MSGLRLTGRLGTFTWRMAATVLAAQSILLFFGALVARGFAIADGGDGSRVLLVGIGLGTLAVIAAGLMRGPWGLPLGWLVQVGTWASAFVVPAMIAVGVIFTGLWLYCLVKGPRAEAAHAAAVAAAAATEEPVAATEAGQ